MFGTIKMRDCKRCGGNVFWARDEYGIYIFCIRCGAVYYTDGTQKEERDSVPQPAAKARSKKTAVYG